MIAPVDGSGCWPAWMARVPSAIGWVVWVRFISNVDLGVVVRTAAPATRRLIARRLLPSVAPRPQEQIDVCRSVAVQRLVGLVPLSQDFGRLIAGDARTVDVQHLDLPAI